MLFEEDELEEIRRVASRSRMTVAEWVRTTLREARRQEPSTDVQSKLACLERAVRHELPTGDIEQMLSDIDRGYAATRDG